MDIYMSMLVLDDNPDHTLSDGDRQTLRTAISSVGSCITKVLEFHEAFSTDIHSTPHLTNPGINAMRNRLIQEEFDEYKEAVESGDTAKAVKELADLLYVVLGTAVAQGLPLGPGECSESLGGVHGGEVAT